MSAHTKKKRQIDGKCEFWSGYGVLHKCLFTEVTVKAAFICGEQISVFNLNRYYQTKHIDKCAEEKNLTDTEQWPTSDSLMWILKSIWRANIPWKNECSWQSFTLQVECHKITELWCPWPSPVTHLCTWDNSRVGQTGRHYKCDREKCWISEVDAR